MTIHAHRDYLQKHRFAPRQITSSPSPALNMVIVIPCFRETDLSRTLQSLEACQPPTGAVEVILVFNSSEKSPNSVINFHTTQIGEISAWAAKPRKHQYHLLHFPTLQHKHAGVGLARKIGMDEAVDRLYQVNREKGLIVCLDGDSQVAPNYLVEIERYFAERSRTEACSISFAHPLNGADFSPEVYTAITQYELFLRYYIEGLRFAGFPYAYHTIGSAMVVRSDAYQARGGMNRRKAGEDFYFLHKFIPEGRFGELCETKVIPSPRPSDRVPFGTGKAIQERLNQPESVYMAYDPRIFAEFKVLLDQVPALYEQAAVSLPPSVLAWAESVDLSEQLREARSNVRDASSFPKRFYQWLDALKVLQYVHFARDHYYPNQPLQDCAETLWQMGAGNMSPEFSGPELSEKDWLLHYREKQQLPWQA